MPLSPSAAIAATPTRVRWTRVAAFFAIALAVSGLLSVPFALGVLPEEAVGLVVPIAQLAPLIAALIVRDRSVRRRDALALTVPSRRALWQAAGVAVLAFASVPLVRAAIALVTGSAQLGAGDGIAMIVVAVPVVLVLQTLFGIGEELGWRGWLQTTLSPLGFWASSLVIGVLWALWHLPIVIALGLAGRELAAYLLVILAVAPLLSALRVLGMSMWPAVLGHGLLNSLRVAIDQNLLSPASERGDGAFWIVEASGWALWLLAAFLVMRVAGRRAGSHRPGALARLVRDPSCGVTSLNSPRA